MSSILAHNNVAARQFLTPFKSAFTTRLDGSTRPNWERTWIHAYQYFRALLRPGKRKSITGLASRVGADQERLERFVRESAWEPAAVQDQLRATVPDGIDGPDAGIVVDGMGIPKQGQHSVGVGSQWCGATTSVGNCQVTINCTVARLSTLSPQRVDWRGRVRLRQPTGTRTVRTATSRCCHPVRYQPPAQVRHRS